MADAPLPRLNAPSAGREMLRATDRRIRRIRRARHRARTWLRTG